MIKLSFQPKQITKKLLAVLNDRSRDILTKRYGLDPKNPAIFTLESIGKEYNITRERVRQIEEYSLSSIRKSDAYKDSESIIEELKGVIDDMGSIVPEDDLLEELSKSKTIQNQIHFILVVGSPFFKKKDDEFFKHRWYIDQNLMEQVEDSIKNIYANLSKDDIITEAQMVNHFLDKVQNISEKYKNDAIIKRWLKLSKKINSNPLGEWGRSDSSNINVKGIRDYAYLVIRDHGSPIHFKEVAESIAKIFNKKAHVATCHNELIKDPRFVLVGRGLYALTEWGYASGVVKDVIKNILIQNGPLSKEEIVNKVLKERYVKENTILVNLQNGCDFVKNEDNTYSLVCPVL